MTDTDKGSLRYVVTAVCSFDFVNEPTPDQERDIPKLLEEAVTKAVDGYTTRNTKAATVEFVSVSAF